MSSPITDLLVFTDPVTVPDDADTLNAASVTAAGVGFQALADRTRNVANRTGGLVGAGEFLYLDGAGVAADRSRTRVISAFAMEEGRLQVAAVQFWTVAQFTNGGVGYSRTSQSDFARLTCDVALYLPDGSTLTNVEALVAPGAARASTANRMQISLFRQTPSFSTPAIPVTVGPINQNFDDGTTAVQVIALSSAVTEVIGRTSHVSVQIIAGNDAGTNKDDVHALRLSYDVPGPNAF